MSTQEQERTWRPGRPVPVGQILSILRRGGGDPTYAVDGAGAVWRGTRTPEGTAAIRIQADPAEGVVRATAWGSGAAWVLDSLPAMLGDLDDPTGFEPPAPLRDAWRRHAHWRLTRTGLVLEALVPAIIEQKVTGQEAFAGFAALVRRFGEPAPGPGPEWRRLWVQPSPEEIARVPSWEWLGLHIDGGRSRPLMHAVRHARALETAPDLDTLDRRMRHLPGIGVWTSAEVRFRALGDADAVSFGDYHVAKNVGWALTGSEVDDDGLAELLEPYRPHRHRVQRLVELAGLRRPRHGARMAPRRHLPRRA